MIKVQAFKMRLKDMQVDEYARRHDQIWPEVEAILKARGIVDYSIFFDAESATLFACMTLEHDLSVDDMGHDAVMQDWWDYMSDIVVTQPNGVPTIDELRLLYRLNQEDTDNAS